MRKEAKKKRKRKNKEKNKKERIEKRPGFTRRRAKNALQRRLESITNGETIKSDNFIRGRRCLFFLTVHGEKSSAENE